MLKNEFSRESVSAQVFATIAYCHVVNAVPELEEHLPKHDTLMPNACYVFLEDWLRDEKGRQAIKPLLRELETSWGIYGLLKELPPETAAGCTTFPIADAVILEYLNEMLLHHTVTGLPLREIIKRQAGSPGTRQARADSL